jgi:hypothetical protein
MFHLNKYPLQLIYFAINDCFSLTLRKVYLRSQGAVPHMFQSSMGTTNKKHEQILLLVCSVSSYNSKLNGILHSRSPSSSVIWRALLNLKQIVAAGKTLHLTQFAQQRAQFLHFLRALRRRKGCWAFIF